MDLWVNCGSKLGELDLNTLDTSAGENQQVGVFRRMGSIGRKRVVPLCFSSPSKTPLKKPFCSRVNSDGSHLEGLPQDILIRILCGVDHDDLDQLMFVSSTIRDATVIAKQWHFEFHTPRAKTARFGSFTGLEEENNLDSPEAPNAPKQRKSYRSRTRGRKFADITVALFNSSEEE